MSPNDNIVFPVFGEDASTVDIAGEFAKAGIYVGPLENGSKNPGSILGRNWELKTTCDYMEAVDMMIGRPAGCGLFIHAGRSNLIIMDVDNPDAVPAEWWPFLDKAPFQSTRDNVPRKGHYFFMQEAGRRFGNSNGRTGRAWGEMRGINGVVVTQPTVHEKASEGGRYRIVRGGLVPVLPRIIAELLPDVTPAATAKQKDELRNFLATHNTGPMPGSIDGVLRRFHEEVNQGGSRHVAAVTAACWLAREAAAGLYAANLAYEALKTDFEVVLSGERTMWRPEYEDIWCWAIAQATPERVKEIKDRMDEKRTKPSPQPEAQQSKADECGEALGCRFSLAIDDMVHGDACPLKPKPKDDKATPALMYPTLPASFWDERPILDHIRRAAHAEGSGADVTFHAFMARFASMLPHSLKLNTGAKRPTGLNYFVAAMGQSGGGKSSGADSAESLLPTWPNEPNEYRFNLPVGSGQGIPAQFIGKVGTGKDSRWEQVRHNLHFKVDEGEVFARFAQQASDILGPTLRSAWTGGELGQSNASEDRNRFIPAGSYSIGLIAGFQPGTASSMFEETMGGTPQRFLFSAVADPNIPRNRTSHPGALTNLVHIFREGSDWTGEMHLPENLKDEVYQYVVDVNAGRIVQDALDAHYILHKCRIAALLALLDYRKDVNEDDWRLAQVIWDTSVSVRNVVLAQQQQEASRRWQQEKERLADAATYSARKVAEDTETRASGKVMAMAERIKVLTIQNGGEFKFAGTDGLKKKFDTEKRKMLPEALEFGEENGMFEHDEQSVRIVKKARQAAPRVVLDDPYEK